MAMQGNNVEVDTRNAKTAARAYQLWEQEGCPHGRDLDHWFAAEAEQSVQPKAAQASKKSRKRAG
ncbi:MULTISPECIES: DUF2934 domain-containing protein [Sphingomonadales]|nr:MULTISPECIES: DUF2934 domain-containing protein [Sphingomonadales]|tara:strand:+ start:691 stop:885 length:195 start_codon:yes stop_codon:yes gene_type:complete